MISNQNPAIDTIFEANKRAILANRFAMRGRLFFSNFQKNEKAVEHDRAKMGHEPVGTFTLLFFICFLADVLVAWEMYQGIVEVIIAQAGFWGAVVIALVVNGAAVAASHWLSLSLSKSIFEWEVDRMVNIQNGGLLPYPMAAEAVEAKRKIWFWLGMGASVVVLAVSVAIVVERDALIAMAATPESDDLGLGGLNLPVEQFEYLRYLPIVFILLEIFFGVYLWFFFIRLADNFRAFWNHFRFKSMLKSCAEHDEFSANLLDEKHLQNHPAKMSKQLRDAVWRRQRRSMGDDYLNEWSASDCIFEVLDHESRPLDGAHVVGKLPGGELSNGVQTNRDGRANARWEGPEFLEAVLVGGFLKKGPFQRGLVHTIRLGAEEAALMKMQVSPNGVSSPATAAGEKAETVV